VLVHLAVSWLAQSGTSSRYTLQIHEIHWQISSNRA